MNEQGFPPDQGVGPSIDLSQQSHSAPKRRGLAMEIAGRTGAVEVVLDGEALVGADADVFHISILVDLPHQAKPGFSRGRAEGLFIEPALFHARDESEREHSGARSHHRL